MNYIFIDYRVWNIFLLIVEYVAKEPKDTPHDATSVMDRNATTLFLSELFRGSLTHMH